MNDRNSGKPSPEYADARDCMHLMLLEFGEVHIETLGQLLQLTNAAERDYSHICNRRLVTGD